MNHVRERTVSTPNRRTIVAGVGWAVPAVTVAATAPASAASLPPKAIAMESHQVTTKGNNGAGYCFWDISGVGTSSNGTLGVTFHNLVPSDVITSATVTFWLPLSNIAWSSDYGNWTALKRGTATMRNSYGVTLYEYTSTYQGPQVTGRTGDYTIPFGYTNTNDGSSVCMPVDSTTYPVTQTVATVTRAGSSVPFTSGPTQYRVS